MQFQEFRDRAEARKRYWARSAIGWQWITARTPNAAHRAVAQMESRGLVSSVITQNVDGLHQRAGSRNVLELHGTLSRAVCLTCNTPEPRRRFQERILALNPRWEAEGTMAPDGDADVTLDRSNSFVVPTCTRCGGVMKPDVVFFGESVPSSRVEEAFGMVRESRVLLVLGSSLTVFSGFRFVKRASELEIPVAIVNQGSTRGDPLATVVLDAPLEDVLPRIAGS